MGVRARLTLVTTGVLALALGGIGALAVVSARSALIASLDDAALQRAQEVAGLLEAGTLPDPVPVTGAAVVQVVDSADRVVASSPGGDRLSPLLDRSAIEEVRSGTAVPLDGSRVGSGEPFRVLGVPAGQGRGDTVLVATSVAEVQRAGALVTRAVLLSVPGLLLLMGVVTWRVTGSALRPVEELRRAAAGMAPVPAGGSGGRGLPVPPTDDEVARLAETLNDMLGRLDDAAARQRAFVADAAHELRSPLTSLRTQLEVALARPATQDWPDVARGGLADAERMSVLVDDLLLLARLAESAPPTGRVDLAAVVAESAGRPRRRPVEVAGPAQVDVLGDRRALGRAVDNLLDNAARYATTTVAVEVSLVDGVAEVQVVDDGPGIAAADRERVFERFTRLDPARDRDAGGSGLGLAIVRGVVERHGGTAVALDRADGCPGAVVRVRLPAA